MFTVAYLTNRKNPRFEWFRDSLLLQLRQSPDLSHNPPQVVVVDAALWDDPHERKAMVDPLRNHLAVWHLPPKPSVWQGTSRLTTRNYFAAANARNTAACVAYHKYIMFVDDLSVLCDSWVKDAYHAALHQYVVCGAYKKVKNLVVENGEVKSYEPFPPGVDSRWEYGSSEKRVKIGGGQMFGCSFGLPLEDYLAVNGSDEICDAIGGEDYNLGLRLEKLGRTIWYNRNMLTLESEEAHYEDPPFIRVDKKTPDNPDGHDSSNVILTRTFRGGMNTMGNLYNLRELRQRIKGGQSFPVPTEPATHWPDGQPLGEM